jgi:RNA polymerase-interacting CarD/CdnL/TRCF family regulator
VGIKIPKGEFMMDFPIGSTVIHAKYGLGEITQIEETFINGQISACYIVKTHDLMIWVPIADQRGLSSLRAPTPKTEFEDLLAILHAPSEPLPDDRKERKSRLLDQLTDGSVVSVCRLVRDLSGYGNKKKLSDDDKSILERAKNTLLTEWAFSLSVPVSQAQKRMGELLQTA